MTPFTSSRTNSKPRFPFLSHVFPIFLILCPTRARYRLFTWPCLMMEKTCRDFLKEFSRAWWYRRTYGSHRIDNVNFFRTYWRVKSEIRCWIVVVVLLLLIWSGWNDLFVCWWSQWDSSVIKGWWDWHIFWLISMSARLYPSVLHVSETQNLDRSITPLSVIVSSAAEFFHSTIPCACCRT